MKVSVLGIGKNPPPPRWGKFPSNPVFFLGRNLWLSFCRLWQTLTANQDLWLSANQNFRHICLPRSPKFPVFDTQYIFKVDFLSACAFQKKNPLHTLQCQCIDWHKLILQSLSKFVCCAYLYTSGECGSIVAWPINCAYFYIRRMWLICGMTNNQCHRDNEATLHILSRGCQNWWWLFHIKPILDIL